jgi:DNA polymerase
MATRATAEQQTAAPLVPERATIDRLQEAAAGCRACDLWRTGTQTVFGDGSRSARIVFVGEQPGDEEDVQGRPFVGPAGRQLDKALVEAGIDRRDVYVTNVVKHFKW